MPHLPQLEVPRVKRDELNARLAANGNMGSGSLVERFRRCGKPTCHCAQKDSPGHGPRYSLTRPILGKTMTRIILKRPPVARTREQIAQYRRFRDLSQELTAVSEQICDAQLPSAAAPGQTLLKTNLTRGAARHRPLA
jgi:hypothetical protein